MNSADFAALTTGDRIRPECGDDSFAIESNLGVNVLAVRVVYVLNASEWMKGSKALNDIRMLKRGELIEHKRTGNEYVVTSTHMGVAVAAKTVLISEKEAANWMVAAKPTVSLANAP